MMTTKMLWVIVGVVALLLVSVAAVFFVIIFGNPFSGFQNVAACQEAVEGRLVAPATAEYVEIRDTPERYRLVGHDPTTLSSTATVI